MKIIGGRVILINRYAQKMEENGGQSTRRSKRATVRLYCMKNLIYSPLVEVGRRPGVNQIEKKTKS